VISQFREHMPVTRLCDLVGASKSWYYDSRRKTGSVVCSEVVLLRDAVEEIALEFPGYGYRRVTKALARDGMVVNHKRVLRIMREESLLCHLRRRWIVTTDSQHTKRVYPNLAKGMCVTGLNQLWVADITYVRLPRAFVYLACVLDARSRKVIGWSMSEAIDTMLALRALWMALNDRNPSPSWVHHSDRGVQYASEDYIQALAESGARISMSGKGNPYDNAFAEAFFRTLKVEQVNLNDYGSYQEAVDSIGEFIEAVYNRKRLHSSIGYVPPEEFEEHTDLESMGVIPC